jgi:aspartate carbamoyltransferase catalytic subunit
VEAFDRVEPALEGADVVMMLRIQLERKAGGRFPNTREYSRLFGLNPRRLALAKPDAIVMHPGPMNRGVEIDPAVADGPRSVILDQVARGVAIRMAVLYLLGGGSDATE